MPVLGQNNTPDSSFNNTGYVVTPVGSARDEVTNLVVQPDGKTIVLGFAYNGASTESEMAMVRYNTDGSLDSGFGNNGKVLHKMVAGHNRAYGIALQSDKKVVVAAWLSASSVEDWGVVRFLPTGKVDSTFGVNGNVVLSFGDKQEAPVAVCIQSDQKILIGGYYYLTNVAYRFAIARLNTNGSPDNSFDGDGKATHGDAGTSYYGYSMLLQDDGRIVIGGTASDGKIWGGLARFDSNGTPDATFGNGGLAKLPLALNSSNIYGIARQWDGRYLLCGYRMNPTMDFVLMRSHMNGMPDSSFGVNGITGIDFASKGDRAYFVIPQADGKILVAGDAYDTKFNLALARFRSDGKVDSAFGTQGKILRTAGNYATQGMVAALQADGKIVAAGHATISGSNADFALFRTKNVIVANRISETKQIQNMRIFPNPAGSRIQLDFSLVQAGDLEIRMLDAKGSEIRKWDFRRAFSTGNQHVVLDLPQGLQGMYLLHVSSGKNRAVYRIQVLQH